MLAVIIHGIGNGMLSMWTQA